MRHARTLPRIAPAVWWLAGAALVAQVLVPWTRSGLLSVSSPLDVVRLQRADVISGVVPVWTAPALLLLPALGLGLCLLAILGASSPGPHRRRRRLVRWSLGAVCVVLGLGSLAVATAGQPGRMGLGAALTAAGVGLVVVGAALDLLSPSRRAGASAVPVSAGDSAVEGM